MKSKFILFVLPFLMMASCSVGYDVDMLKSDEPECIIVSALLNPAKPVQVELYRLQNDGNLYSYTALKGANVIIREEQKIIYDGVCEESMVKIDYFPLTNASYSIEVSFEGLKTVRAHTQVPPVITCTSSFHLGEYRGDFDYIIELNAFEIPPAEKIGMWVTSYEVCENDEEVQYNEMYTKNAFVDKTNSVAGMPVKNETVGSIYHNGFLRVKNKNLPFLDELVFTPNYVMDARLPQRNLVQTGIKVKVMTASPEYDQFCKSLYEQKSMIVYEGDISSIFFQPKTVYSNIENGLGIFAGVSEMNYVFDLPTRGY